QSSSFEENDQIRIKENEKKKEEIGKRVQEIKQEESNDRKLSRDLSELFSLINSNITDIKSKYTVHLEPLDKLHSTISTAFVDIQAKIDLSIKQYDENKDVEQRKARFN
uniref:hypothetical protein n=1 Tax=Thalassobacillus sp. C254 TaxID=1225341 RepID=UPI0018DC821F